jgi:tetraacyldisaccharide 4'-kinase
MSLRTAWLFERDESLWRRLALSPLVPLAMTYATGGFIRQALFDRGVLRRSRFPGRVVSVGTQTVGGRGTAQLTAWVATGLRHRGHKVAIVGPGCRGRKRDGVTVVSDGRFVRSRVEIAGGDAMVLAAHAPGIPVLVGRDRALVGWRALSAFGADVLVLDDGFAYRRLHRDVDIVCFDGSLGFGNRWVLPRGPLRETARALRRAQAIGVVDGPFPAADTSLVARIAGGARLFAARDVPAALRALRGDAAEAPSVLGGREVGVLAGMRDPGAFRRTLESLGARIVAERLFRDGHRYRPRDLRGLAGLAPLWVTTERDAAKILPTWTGGADLRVLRIETEVSRGGEVLDWIDSRLH